VTKIKKNVKILFTSMASKGRVGEDGRKGRQKGQGKGRGVEGGSEVREGEAPSPNILAKNRP